MSSQENEKVVRDLLESINAKDPDRGASLMADDCRIEDVPTGVTRTGPEGWRETFDHWMPAFPDAQIEITRLVSTDRNVVAEYTGTGTHDGPLRTDEGDIPPTGRRGETQFCDVYEVRNGKITSLRSYWDAMSLMRQLGVLPEMAQRQ